MGVRLLIFMFFGLGVLWADFIYEHYKPDKAFAKYFSKENCSLVMDKYYYTNCYSFEHKGPKAIAYQLEESILNLPPTKERNKYKYDLEIPSVYRTYTEDYIDNEYTKAQIVSGQSMGSTPRAYHSTFLMSSITPQKYQLNQTIWQKLQQRERKITSLQGNAQILNIILYGKDPAEIEYIKNNIAIPKYFIKIIKAKQTQECYAIPNQNPQNQDLQFYKVDCKWFI